MFHALKVVVFKIFILKIKLSGSSALKAPLDKHISSSYTWYVSFSTKGKKAETLWKLDASSSLNSNKNLILKMSSKGQMKQS